MIERERLEPDRSGDLHRYAEQDRTAILQNLRRMVDGKAPIAVFDGAGHSALGRADLLNGHELVVELDPDEVGSRALSAPFLTLVALVQDVKVQFDVRGPLVPEPDSTRVSLPLPPQVHRLQRRGGFRVRPPSDESAFVHLDAGSRPLRVWDVSVLGVGLAWPVEVPLPEIGARWTAARLRLGLHLLPCDLVVRNVVKPRYSAPRVGCAFEGVPLATQRQLERLVMDLERRAILARCASEL